MTKAIANQIHEYRAYITMVILGACFITAAFYGYNLYSLVSKTVSINKIESKAAALASTINDLDSKYLKLSSEITPDALSQYGLEPGVVAVYITKQTASASLGNLARGGHEL